MRIFSGVMILLILAFSAMAGILERDFSFQPLNVEGDGEYDLLMIEGLAVHAEPGAPILPYQAITVLLPMGEELVEVRIIEAYWETAGYTAMPRPGSPRVPLSKREMIELKPDQAIYGSESVYPAEVIGDVQTGFYCGHGLGSCKIHPVRWNPKSGEVEQLTYLRIELVTESTRRASSALSNLRHNLRTCSKLESITSDLGSMATYGTENLDELDELPGKFLIICDQAHDAAWQEYVTFKQLRGLETILLTTQDIYATYPGNDNQTKIRNAIIDYYQNEDVESVLLGGDVAYVPYRGFYVTAVGYTDTNMPADLYYAGLDGTWNDDGDGYWAEIDEADLYQEVIIGRAPITSVGMIEIWINKQIMFQTEPVVDEITQAIMLGEDLGWSVWGGEYKDEIRLGSANHGYTTVGFPEEWTVETLYDMNGTWTVPQLFAELNSGVTYVNHLGHANVTYALKASNANINTNELTNDGINHNFYLGYTQGCNCGSFENNSITELWTTIETGAFAFISNSRYGWGDLYTTDGPSQHYDREFFDALYGEDLHRTGDANRDSKHDNIPNINGSCMRWCFYEINLFGDPTIDLYTGAVNELTVEHPPVFVLGGENMTVTVVGVPGAVVAVSQAGELLDVAETDISGNATVSLDVQDLDPLHIVVTAHNSLQYVQDILVIVPDGMYPIVNDVVVDDSGTGNGNGMADYGEQFDLTLEILNVGNETIDYLEIQAATDLNYLTIDPDAAIIENVAPDETASVVIPATVSVDAQDGVSAPITVTMTSDPDSWEQNIAVGLHAPNLELTLLRVNDEAGNDNHRLDPGETGSMDILLTNDGTADLSGATFDVFVNDPNLDGLVVNAGAVTVSAEGSVELDGAFDLDVVPGAPDMEKAWVRCELSLENGYQWSQFICLEIGGVFNDLEGPDQGWTHFSPPDWADQWHVSTERNWTPDGSFAWKAGDPEGGEYLDFVDACLDLPVLEVPGTVVLSFYHWLDAETSNYWTGECYDGGRIEISTDGVNWTAQPMPGYNYITRGTGPFGEGELVYSGSIDWTEELVLIEADPGDLYVRFRFGTDQGVTAEGWYIDDISITLPGDLTPPNGLTAEVTGETASLQWFTPNGQLAGQELLGFIVYRDGSPISEIIQQTGYDDPLGDLPSGIYLYTVAAVYDEGESDPAGPVSVAWGSLFLTIAPLVENVVIEPGGGNFWWEAEVINATDAAIVFDAWTEVVLPNGNPYGPLFMRENLTIQPNQTLTPAMIQQSVPGYAPAGIYTYVAKVGTYPDEVIASDDFDFEKLPGGGLANTNMGWNAEGWDDDKNGQMTVLVPSEFSLNGAYPNPFNPVTTITVGLPQAVDLRIAVYNILGRQVAMLADGRFSQGYHSFAFDGQTLSSGIYFIQATVPGKMDELRKVVLTK